MLWILTLAGFLVSILSALESRVQWLARFCAFFGEGCRRTEDFTLFKVPISWWGIGYYAGLALLLLFGRPAVLWYAMAGFGFELTFLWIMVSIRAFCVFCLFNALVVAGLVWLCFDPAYIWPSATLALLLFIASNHLISRENVARMAPASEEPPEAAAAKIEDEIITNEDLERPLSQRIYKLENQIYRLKRRRLQMLIRDILLDKEAARRRMPKQQLLDTLSNGDPEVSTDEIERYRRQNPAQVEAWEDSTVPVKAQIRKFLAEKKKKQKIADFADSLQERYAVKILLSKPALPLTQVDIEGRPAMGPSDAEVVVVEFSDPFCPACRTAHKATLKVKEAYGDRVRWVFKDFPLETHQGAKKAAEAAHCAGEAGKFWEYQDKVFKAEEKPDTDRLKAYARDLDLDRDRFDACLEEGKYRSQVESDIQEGRAAGISATPTFIINGEMISGALSLEEFKEKIEAELEGN